MELSKFQCVIIAGGRGTRLRPLTNNVPKPMVPVNGLPFIHRLIERIKIFKISRFLILTGYKGKTIQDYFGNGGKFNCSISYNHEDSPLGSGGALLAASELLDKDFFFVNGDDYIEVDFSKMFFEFQKKDLLALVAANKNFNGQLMINEETGIVTKYSHSRSNNYLDCGTKIFNRNILHYLPKEYPSNLESSLFPKLIDKKQLAVFRGAFGPRGIDTMEKLSEFRDWYSNNELN